MAGGAAGKDAAGAATGKDAAGGAAGKGAGAGAKDGTPYVYWYWGEASPGIRSTLLITAIKSASLIICITTTCKLINVLYNLKYIMVLMVSLTLDVTLSFS